MSVHTYIGARYVPRFIGTYDPTQQYEALDVVDNGAGTSYIARDIVPAGTPLTDTTHWFLYGASSGAIISLGNRVTTLENMFPVMADDISNHMIVLGDSYTSPIRYTDPWCNFVAEHFGCTLHNMAKDGASFTGAGGYDTLIDEIDLAIADTTIPANGVKYILILAGVNEINFSGTLSGIESNFRLLLNKIKTAYPYAKIICLGSNNKTRFAGTTSLNPYAINNTLKTVLSDYGLPLYNLTNFFIGMPIDSSGHPTAAFEKEISKAVIGLIEGTGYSRTAPNEAVTVITATGATVSGVCGVHMTEKALRFLYVLNSITLATASVNLPTIVVENPYDILTDQMTAESSYKPYVAALNGLKNFGTGMLENSDRITFSTVGDAPAAATNGGIWADISFFTDNI